MANNKWTKNFINRSEDEFFEFIEEHNSKFFNLNLENKNNTKSIAYKLKAMLFDVNPFGINQIRHAFAEMCKNHNIKTSSELSFNYYIFRGYDNEYAKTRIAQIQRTRSKRCIEYWLNNGYSEIEALEKVSEIQKKNGRKLGNKLRNDPEFKKTFSVWSEDHWIAKGYSKINAKNKIKEFNPSCEEFYKSSEAFVLGKKNISNRVKKLWQNGVYDDKIKIVQTRYTSKQEKIFFELLRASINNIIYEPFGVNVREHSEDYYYVYDGYYRMKTGIILLEYDGTYWHDTEKDKKRDELVLSIRPDIIGVIRTNDYYFYKHKINITQFKDAIRKIKSKESSRILLYESA